MIGNDEGWWNCILVLRKDLRFVKDFLRRGGCEYLGQVLELSETGVKSHCVIAPLPKSPTRLDLPHRPHLVDALRQLVPDVLHKAGEN